MSFFVNSDIVMLCSAEQILNALFSSSVSLIDKCCIFFSPVLHCYCHSYNFHLTKQGVFYAILFN